jgi:hypothetical protein
MASEVGFLARSRRRWGSALGAVAMAWGFAAVAPLALGQQAAAGPSDADRVAARQLMDAGRAKERAGDKAGALAAYLAADRIMGVPTTGLSVAQAALDLGKLVEARDVLLRVVRHPPSATEPLPFAKARLEARDLAAELDRRIPSLSLVVTGATPGVLVTVTIDGTEVPREALPFPRAVNPGKRQVVAAAPEHRTVRKVVTVIEGEQAKVELALEPGEDDESGLSLDGTSPLVWVGLGVTVVGLGVGITSGALAMSRSSELEGVCTDYACPASRRSDIDSLSTLAHTSTVGFVVAGAGALLGVVAFAALSDWTSGSPSGAPGSEQPGSEAASTEPAVTVRYGPGALLVRGRF